MDFMINLFVVGILIFLAFIAYDIYTSGDHVYIDGVIIKKDDIENIYPLKHDDGTYCIWVNLKDNEHLTGETEFENVDDCKRVIKKVSRYL